MVEKLMGELIDWGLENDRSKAPQLLGVWVGPTPEGSSHAKRCQSLEAPEYFVLLQTYIAIKPIIIDFKFYPQS